MDLLKSWLGGGELPLPIKETRVAQAKRELEATKSKLSDARFQLAQAEKEVNALEKEKAKKEANLEVAKKLHCNVNNERCVPEECPRTIKEAKENGWVVCGTCKMRFCRNHLSKFEEHVNARKCQEVQEGEEAGPAVVAAAAQPPSVDDANEKKDKAAQTPHKKTKCPYCDFEAFGKPSVNKHIEREHPTQPQLVIKKRKVEHELVEAPPAKEQRRE